MRYWHATSPTDALRHDLGDRRFVALDVSERNIDAPPLFVVQIETNCGFYPEPDWQDNTPPQPIYSALDEAAKLRITGWITRILPAKGGAA